MIELNDIEVRVLGSLIEKQFTTPDYYPMTLKGLATACNQKSNRNPIVELDERIVLRTLDQLREKKLVSLIHQASSRVPKYDQQLQQMLQLNDEEAAILAELMLRGPQTVGELRSRASRMALIDSLEQAEEIIERLVERNEGKLLMQLPLQPGRKERRYMQLLAGEPDPEMLTAAPPAERIRLDLSAETERLAKLEEEVQTLRGELAELRETFAQFKSQFE